MLLAGPHSMQVRICPLWSCRVINMSAHRWETDGLQSNAHIILSRIRSRRAITSLRPWDDMAWSPITFRIPDLQKRHLRSFLCSLTLRRNLKATWNSFGEKSSPTAGMLRTSQLIVLERERESIFQIFHERDAWAICHRMLNCLNEWDVFGWNIAC